ncbi:MAG: SAM-dependent methyltransferase [Chlorobi bacterium]|nr:SAM-dependent methyltransferase [Chlorobiota bacterium]
MPRLYLIPNVLSEAPWETALPNSIHSACTGLKYFIVENVRTARRFLKKLDQGINIDELSFYELNKRTSEEEKQQSIGPLLKGYDMGIISEAGCPGVADPGAEIVRLAHAKGIRVVPLVGPSSILLAMMASGMNGQNFAFTGYIPVKPNQRVKRIKQLEKLVQFENQPQIFIETPYRNNQLLDDLLKYCNNSTLLCIACDLTSETEFIATKSIAGWKKDKPDLNKRPAIFILGR